MGLGCPDMRFYAILDHVKAVFVHFGQKQQVEDFSILTRFWSFVSDFATEPLIYAQMRLRVGAHFN